MERLVVTGQCGKGQCIPRTHDRTKMHMLETWVSEKVRQ